jgi:hypothetical protein
MSSIVFNGNELDRKIDGFMKRHKVRDMSVDEMIEDLAAEGRKSTLN